MADILIKVDGIAGELRDATHLNEIDVIKWSSNVSQPSSMLSRAGRGAGKFTVTDFGFTYEIDQNAMSGSGRATTALLNVKSNEVS
jgi:type VI secretion system secreted protein Hcp